MSSKTSTPTKDASLYKNKLIRSTSTGAEFVSTKNKQGIYTWVRVKEMEETKTPDEYWLQFPQNKQPKKNLVPTLKKLEVVQKELKQHNIYMHRVGWKNVWNMLDFAWTEAERKVAKVARVKKLLTPTSDVMDVASLVFWSASLEYSARKEGKLHLQHSILKEDVPTFIEIMKKHFGKKFKWSGKVKDAIAISL